MSKKVNLEHPECFSDSSKNIAELLTQNYCIICDTNVLLGLYRLSPDYANFALECLKTIKDDLYLPYTVKIEFSKHCDSLYKRRQDEIENVAHDMMKLSQQQKVKMMNGIGALLRRQFPEIQEVQSEIEKKYDEVEELLTEYFDDRTVLSFLKDSWDFDYVKAFAEELLQNDHVLEDFSRDEIYQICEMGEKRYKDQTPPGFKDASNKDGIRKYSDLILWQEVIRYAHSKQKNIIFVTDDIKPDWWRIDGEKYRFLPELVTEFEKKSRLRENENSGKLGPDLHIVPFVSVDFYEAVSNSFEIEKTDAIDQALRLTIDEYMEDIKYKVFESVLSELEISGLEYVGEDKLTQVGSEGIEEWEVETYDLDSFEMVERDGESITYCLTYIVEMTGYSYDYWGRDDDTKEVITSPAFQHSVTGKIMIQIERKVDMMMDFEYECEYENPIIIDSDFEETGFISAYESDDEEYDPDAYDMCPDCNSPISYKNDGGNGFCTKCALNH